MAALIVGVAWGFWHLPLMGGRFAWRDVPAFLLGVFAAAVVLEQLAQFWWIYSAAWCALAAGVAWKAGMISRAK